MLISAILVNTSWVTNDETYEKNFCQSVSKRCREKETAKKTQNLLKSLTR